MKDDATMHLIVVVSGSMPDLGMREAERVLGCDVERVGRRVGLIELEGTRLRSALAKLYECVYIQEILLGKAWTDHPRPEANFYYELGCSSKWDEVIGKAFAVSARKIGGFPSTPSTELIASVAKAVYSACNGQCNVNLTNPDVHIRLICAPDAAVIGIQMLRPRGDRFRLRSNKFKVFKHPASLTPEDARLLVNLASDPELLLDPFCGTGTVLAEAALKGIEVVGLDVSAEAARGCWSNMKLFSADALCSVIVGDARRPPFRQESFDAISTDPPYGRLATTRGAGVQALQKCLLNLSGSIVKRSGSTVFMRPKEYSPWPHFDGLGVVEEYSVYVHGGLTRVVCLLSKHG